MMAMGVPSLLEVPPMKQTKPKDEIAKTTIRMPAALWAKARILAINKGITAESLVVQALTEFMKKGDGR
jgi:hypothetical protein